MSKTINPEIYEYSKKFAIETLSKCELFTRVYGKRFVKNRLLLNYKSCYTNEKSKTTSGYYDSRDASITICSSGKDDELLNISDIENNQDLQQTLLHEAIHACLEKTKRECSRISILSGTGIKETYKSSIDGKESELGRGLNEGYTNWVCNKAGYPSKSYIDLTEIVKELEVIVGSEKVMALGKGGMNYGKMPELLQMESNEVEDLLLLTDAIYKCGCRQMDYDIIHSNLVKIENEWARNPNETLEGLEEELQGFSCFAKLNEDLDYAEFLKYHGGQDNNKNRIRYFKEKSEKETNLIEDYRTRIEETLLDKLLSGDLNNIQDEDERMQKMADFFKLTVQTEKSPMKECQEYFEKTRDKFIKIKIEKLKHQIKDEKMSLKEIMAIVDKYYNLYNDSSDILKRAEYRKNILIEVSKEINPQSAEATARLIESLSSDGNIEDFENYKILKIFNKDSSGNIESKVDAYIKDGKIVGYSSYVGAVLNQPHISERKITDEIPNDSSELFDFTVSDLSKIQNVVNQVLKMKDDLMKQDPNAELIIVDRAIIFSSVSRGLETFIVTKDEELVKAEMELSTPNSFYENKKSKENSSGLPTVVKRNIFSDIFLNIKRKLFRNKNGNISLKDTEKEENVSSNSTENNAASNPWKIEGYHERQEKNHTSKSNNDEKKPNTDNIER